MVDLFLSTMCIKVKSVKLKFNIPVCTEWHTSDKICEKTPFKSSHREGILTLAQILPHSRITLNSLEERCCYEDVLQDY